MLSAVSTILACELCISALPGPAQTQRIVSRRCGVRVRRVSWRWRREAALGLAVSSPDTSGGVGPPIAIQCDWPAGTTGQFTVQMTITVSGNEIDRQTADVMAP